MTRSAALFALAALVSLSVAVPGGAQAQMVGAQAAAASHLIARLNEAARTLAGARDESDVKPCGVQRPAAASVRAACPVRLDEPVARGELPRRHRMRLSRLFLPPPESHC